MFCNANEISLLNICGLVHPYVKRHCLRTFDVVGSMIYKRSQTMTLFAKTTPIYLNEAKTANHKYTSLLPYPHYQNNIGDFYRICASSKVTGPVSPIFVNLLVLYNRYLQYHEPRKYTLQLHYEAHATPSTPCFFQYHYIMTMFFTSNSINPALISV